MTKAVRCSVCGLLVGQSDDPDAYGQLVIATPGNHEPIECDGFATPTETPVCSGSERLGHVVLVDDPSLHHLIYDGGGFRRAPDNTNAGSVRPTGEPDHV